MTDVTQILQKVSNGDRRATADLLQMVYDQLRRLAAQRMARESSGPMTLQPTGLVHEVYVRLTESTSHQGWDSREHFFAAATESMRRILIDHARLKQSWKRGGRCLRVDIDCDQISESSEPIDVELLITLDEALTQLATEHPRKARLVSLRIFSGMSVPEAANALGISVATAERDWTFARAWLQRAMSSGDILPSSVNDAA